MSTDGEGALRLFDAPTGDWGEIFDGGIGTVFVSLLSSPPDDDAEPEMIHIVTAGEYSDYEIVDVFEDEDEADAFVVECEQNGYDDPRVESYVLRQRNTPHRQQWHVMMRLSGEVLYARELSGQVQEAVPFSVANAEDFDAWFRKSRGITDRVVWTGRCFAVDEQHAVKIAMEKLMQWKAHTLL